MGLLFCYLKELKIIKLMAASEGTYVQMGGRGGVGRGGCNTEALIWFCMRCMEERRMG